VSWFKLDDKGAFHEKVLRAGNEAYGAWCRAGQYCAERLTDGRLPGEAAKLISPKKSVWQKLVEVRLCELDPDGGGLLIHDYLKYNPTAATVLAERARKAKNIADYRTRTRGTLPPAVTDPVTGYADGDDTGNGPGSEPGCNHVPDPVPDPDPLKAKDNSVAERAAGPVRAKRGTRLADDWAPPPSSYAKVVSQFGLTEAFVEHTLEEFRDYWRGVPGQRGTKLDWDATFRNRLREAGAKLASNGSRWRTAPKVQPPARAGEFDWQKAVGVDKENF
jgi:hypothetical protein